jgi:hypothetical protein
MTFLIMTCLSLSSDGNLTAEARLKAKLAGETADMPNPSAVRSCGRSRQSGLEATSEPQ